MYQGNGQAANAGMVGSSAMNNPTLPAGSGKQQRLRWTAELHERFVEAITQLGGPDRATPKGVQRVMGVPELTIYHIKSHLQKYRLSKYLPESESPSDGSVEGKKGSGEGSSGMTLLQGVQTNEALRMQMEVQKRLHEQLEVQRQLQMRIEAQGKYLQKIIEEQQKLGSVLKGSEASQSADTKDTDKPSDSPSTPDSSAHPPSPSKKQKLDYSSSGGGITPPLPPVTDQKHNLHDTDQDVYCSPSGFRRDSEKELTKQEDSNPQRKMH